MEVTATQRGFEFIQFIDWNQEECSLQQSSAVGYYEDAFDKPGSSGLWLGKGKERMHLGREEVEDLIPHLLAWLKCGSLETENGIAAEVAKWFG